MLAIWIVPDGVPENRNRSKGPGGGEQKGISQCPPTTTTTSIQSIKRLASWCLFLASGIAEKAYFYEDAQTHHGLEGRFLRKSVQSPFKGT